MPDPVTRVRCTRCGLLVPAAPLPEERPGDAIVAAIEGALRPAPHPCVLRTDLDERGIPKPS